MGAPEMLQALLEERRGYLVKGQKDRAAEVDVEIAKLGVAVADDGDPLTDDEAPSGDDLETTDGAPAKGRKK